jgi:hypothetical protein
MTNKQAKEIYLKLEKKEEKEKFNNFLKQQKDKIFLAKQLETDLKEIDISDLKGIAKINQNGTLSIETTTIDNTDNNRKIMVICKDRCKALNR